MSVQTGVVQIQPEVVAWAARRRFTAEYTRRTLRDAAACTKSGERGVLLRREQLCTSHLSAWRQAQRTDARDQRIIEFERENRCSKASIERAEALLALQAKVSELREIEVPPNEDEGCLISIDTFRPFLSRR